MDMVIAHLEEVMDMVVRGDHLEEDMDMVDMVMEVDMVEEGYCELG